ncbi:hypothetical protein M0804_001205 [Polistes exclamans]|nr:hypothetical protein M0804_001205 [Polistes exclamans]
MSKPLVRAASDFRDTFHVVHPFYFLLENKVLRTSLCKMYEMKNFPAFRTNRLDASLRVHFTLHLCKRIPSTRAHQRAKVMVMVGSGSGSGSGSGGVGVSGGGPGYVTIFNVHINQRDSA